MACRVSFFDTAYDPVDLDAGATLSEHLDVVNSPLLFGCRTGLCGTCLVRVEGELPPASAEEQEMLAVLAPGDPRARLACQLHLVGDIRVEPHPEAA
jgi:ferredoxin